MKQITIVLQCGASPGFPEQQEVEDLLQGEYGDVYILEWEEEDV